MAARQNTTSTSAATAAAATPATAAAGTTALPFPCIGALFPLFRTAFSLALLRVIMDHAVASQGGLRCGWLCLAPGLGGVLGDVVCVMQARTGPDYDFFITILRHFFYDFTAFFYDFVTMLREHSLPYRPMFSLVFKPKN